MSSVIGTSAFWQKFLHQVLMMFKQLGTPAFILTLSCADLRWNELILSLKQMKIQIGCLIMKDVTL